MTELRSLCVFCGAAKGASPVFEADAVALGKGMAASGVRLVYGGGGIGIMGVIARTILDHGGDVTGVIPEHLQTAEVALSGLTDLHVVPDMHTRKRMMFERSDAIAVLPGGFGTMDETFEVLTWKQLGLHSKPVIIANTNGYWDGFLQFCQSMVRDGFVKESNLSLFSVAQNAPDALQMAAKMVVDSSTVANSARF